MQIIKVPGINGLGKTKGCRDAGNAVIQELDDVYTSESGKQIDRKLFDLEEIHVDNNNLEEQEQLIYKNSKEAFEQQDKVIFLGGDHSISFPIMKSFKESFENSFLIVFDAHADCMPSINAEKIQEPTHEEWLRALIENGFPADKVVLVGARNIDSEELSFLNKKKINVFNMKEINDDIKDSCDTIMELARGKNIYISIDIDVVDPAFAPATGYPEPGGMTSRQLIYFLQRLNLIKPKAFDIVEIDKEKDKNHENMTIKLGAKILAEII